MNFATENVEFKSSFTEEIYKEVIAFANTDGGTIYVGIYNNGNAVGLTDVDDEYTRITNGIRDAIHPDVTMFVKYTIEDNKVVNIDEHGQITDEKIGTLLDLKKTRIFNLTTQMREMGLIYSKGRGKTKLYFIKK